MRERRDLFAATVLAAACAATCLQCPVVAVRTLAALPLCLALPGYAITAAAFAREELGRPHVLLLSLVLSLATLALGGLVLDPTPSGIERGTWATLLLVVTAGGALVAGVRRTARGPETATSLGRPPRRHTRPAAGAPRLVRPAHAVLLAGAVAAAGASVALSRTVLPARNAVGYTQLWIRAVTQEGRPAVVIGVTSAEQHRTAYRVQMQVRSRRTVVRQRLVLRPGTSARIVVPDPVGGRTGLGRLVFVSLHLLRPDGRDVTPRRAYRQVEVLVPQ